MFVTHNITVDVLRPEPNVIHVVQDDSTRIVRLTLLADQQLYNVAADLNNEDYVGAVSFFKPDGTNGMYDKINVSFAVHSGTSGNPKSLGLYEKQSNLTYVLTEDTTFVSGKTYYDATSADAVTLVSGTANQFDCYLAGQCFTCAGKTQINIVFFTDQGKMLHTFAIEADVQQSNNAIESTNYYRLDSIAALRDVVENAITTIPQPWLTAEEKQQARQNMDAVSSSEAAASAPVKSVNGKTGNIALKSNDIPYKPESGFDDVTLDGAIVYIDLSDQYAEQTEYDSPVSYLAAQDEGCFFVSTNSAKTYCQNIPVGNVAISHVLTFEDDGTTSEYLFVDETLKFRTETLDSIEFKTPIIVPSPTAAGNPVPKSYADTKYTKPSSGIPKAHLASAVLASLDKADSAVQPTGEYNGLTAGLAKNLKTDVGTTDIEAYVSRTAPAYVGDRLNLKKIIGMTLGWNQLCPEKETDTQSGVTVTNDSAGRLTFSGTATANGNHYFLPSNGIPLRGGHKYLVDFGAISGGSIRVYNKTTTTMVISQDCSTTYQRYRLFTLAADAMVTYYFNFASGVSPTGEIAPQLIDLTMVFGAAVADAIYTLETGAAGSGVAWFRKLFPKEFYAYDAGSLQSVTVSAHKTTDTNNVAHSYALDSTKEFRGLPTLDASGNLTADGDEYAPSGTVVRKYRFASVLEGTVWGYDSETNAFYGDPLTAEVFPAIDAPGSNDGVAFAKILGFDTVSYNSLAADTTKDNQLAVSTNGSMYIRADHTNTDQSTFLTAMASAYILYKLATATTESAAAYTEEQLDGEGWTEEFVDAAVEAGTRDVAIPVTAETFYPIDLRAELERVMVEVPPAPTTDGTYVVQCTVSGGTPSYAWTARSAWTGGSY